MRLESRLSLRSQPLVTHDNERCCMPRQIGDVILEVHDLHTHIFTRWGVVTSRRWRELLSAAG